MARNRTYIMGKPGEVTSGGGSKNQFEHCLIVLIVSFWAVARENSVGCSLT